MRDWLLAFETDHVDDTYAAFSTALATALTEEWRRLSLASILEIFISGVEGGEVRFGYVRNSQGLHDHDWTFKQASPEFQAVDDLDQNYILDDLRPGQTKGQLLETRLYSFREGVLLPAAPVFDAFAGIMERVYTHGIEGFDPIASLDDLAYFVRVRMEFLKRLYSPTHGIYKNHKAPLGGEVHVFGVTLDGKIREYPKQRAQARTIRPDVGSRRKSGA